MNLQKFQTVVIVILLLGGTWYGIERAFDLSVKDMFFGNMNVVRIEGLKLNVLIADTDEARKQGLSGRSSFGSADGMLFVFPNSDRHGIWMKDMQFAIDIIWIDEQETIVSIAENVAPNTYPRTFRPSSPAKFVLEVPAGTTNNFDIAEGQKTKLPPKYIAK